jgi:hypothetical protein
MAMYKNIFWRPDMPLNEKGETFANVHLMIGYNQASITDFRKMAAELRKTFPQATDDEICGGKVIKSTYCQGFTLITWNAYIPKGNYTGWRQIDKGKVDYNWQ